MQSFKRGMPLLPAFDDEQPDTEIDAGEPYGLKRWVRYEPATRINSDQLGSTRSPMLGTVGDSMGTPWPHMQIGHF